MASFFGELKRRKVFKVAAVYSVVAWLIIQVVGEIAEPLNLPDWFDAVVIVLLGIGFPIALILAWAFDVTPQGIRAASDAAPVGSPSPSAGNYFAYVSQVLVMLAVGFLVVDQYLLDDKETSVSSVSRQDSSRPVNRFEIPLPENLAIHNSGYGAITVSPDGTQVVFNTEAGLYLRPMDSLESRLIPGSESDFSAPSFSANGESVIAKSREGYWRFSVAGGAPVQVGMDDVGQGRASAARVAADGSLLYYKDRAGIYRIPANGRTPELLIPIAGEYEGYAPELLPDGESVLFSLAPRGANTWDNSRIVVQSLSTGNRKVVAEYGSDALYVPTGHVVYGYKGTLYGVAFDLGALETNGVPVPLVQGVMKAGPAVDYPSANFDIAGDGTLVYLSGAAEGRSTGSLVWVDREGNEESLGFGPGIFAYPRLSPDDSHVAFSTRRGRIDLWVGDLARKSVTRLTIDSEGASPVWARDGSQVFFGANRDILTQPFDGSAPATVLIATGQPDGSSFYPRSISADGNLLLVSNSEPPRDIGMIRLNQDGELTPIFFSPASEVSAELTPDGRWIAYDSNESGRWEVYIRPFPNVDDRRIQVSLDGGRDPLFSRDGKELFYWVDPGTIMSVPIDFDADNKIAVGSPGTVVQGDYLRENAARQYDVSADASRLLMIKRMQDRQSRQAKIVVVQNWDQELTRMVPVSAASSHSPAGN